MGGLDSVNSKLKARDTSDHCWVGRRWDGCLGASNCLIRTWMLKFSSTMDEVSKENDVELLKSVVHPQLNPWRFRESAGSRDENA